MNPLSPTQRALATNAAQRILLSSKCEEAMRLPQTEVIVLPREEAECLAAFAAESLGMKATDFDLGEWFSTATEGGRG